MGFIYEVWDPPGIATFEKKIAGLRPLSASGTVYRFQSGLGQMLIPAGYDRLNEIIEVDTANHANDVASLIRVFRESGELIQELLVQRSPNLVADQPAALSLDGIERVMDWAVVEAWDWDGTADFQSSFPDWIYGGGTVLVDGSFNSPRCDPRISEFWTEATSGNWSALVNGQSTGNTIPFNATALQLEQAYEALSTVDDVLVEGSGTADDPWRVTFVDPCFPTSYSVADGTLNQPLNAALVNQGSFQPSGWTKSQTLQLGQNITFGNYTTFTVDTAPGTPPAGTVNALHIVATKPYPNSFPGAQTVPNVTGGGTYQAGVWVYPVTTNQDFRLVIRDLQEEPLYATSTFPSQTLTANTWTLITIPDVEIPEGVNQVIFRIAAIEDTANFWVTGAFLNEGLAPAPVGEIMGDLLDDAQTDHAASPFPRETITFINKTFSDTLDTSGAAWDSDLLVSIPRGMTYRKVLDRVFGQIGYEWSLTPTVGTPGEWDLNIWNPDGRGTDYSSSDTPSLLSGQGTLSGSATKELPSGNIVISEGAEQYSSRAASSASYGTIGRREWYQADITYYGVDVDAWTDRQLARFLDVTLQPRFEVADPPSGSTRPVPIVDYGIADTLNVDLADGTGKISRQIEAMSWRTVDDGIIWGIHTGQAQFEPIPTASQQFDPIGAGHPDSGLPGPTGAGGVDLPPRFGGGVALDRSNPVGHMAAMGPVNEGVRRLLDNFERITPAAKASALMPMGGGGAPTFVISTTDSSSYSQDKADLVLPANADMTDSVNAVFADLTTQGFEGRVLFTEGYYAYRPDELIVTSNIKIEGMGWGNTFFDLFQGSGAIITFASTASVCQMENIQFFGATGNTIQCDSDVTIIRNIYMGGGDGKAIQVTGALVWLDSWWITGGGGIHVTGTSDVIITNIHATGGDTSSGDGSFILVEDSAYVSGTNIKGTGAGDLDAVIPSALIKFDGADHCDFTNVNFLGNGTTHAVIFDTSTHCRVQGDFDGTYNTATVLWTGSQFCNIFNSTFDAVSADTGEGAFYFLNSDDCSLRDSFISYALIGASTDIIDAIQIETSDRTMVLENTVRGHVSAGTFWRNAVNVISGNDNVVIGNDLRDSNATAPIADTGTGTLLDWPNDATNGDNFT